MSYCNHLSINDMAGESLTFRKPKLLLLSKHYFKILEFLPLFIGNVKFKQCLRVVNYYVS